MNEQITALYEEFNPLITSIVSHYAGENATTANGRRRQFTSSELLLMAAFLSSETGLNPVIADILIYYAIFNTWLALPNGFNQPIYTTPPLLQQHLFYYPFTQNRNGLNPQRNPFNPQRSPFTPNRNPFNNPNLGVGPQRAPYRFPFNNPSNNTNPNRMPYNPSLEHAPFESPFGWRY